MRHEIYCINCGERKSKGGRVRLNSEQDEEIEIDCKNCGILTGVLVSFDEKANQAKIEVENLKPEECVVRWKKVTKDWNPVFICPFCGVVNLEEIITKNGGENLFECKKCKRNFEIEYI